MDEFRNWLIYYSNEFGEGYKLNVAEKDVWITTGISGGVEHRPLDVFVR